MNTAPKSVFTLYYVGINLKKGVTPAQFEDFVCRKGVAIAAYPGWQWTLLRGLRGERKHQYLMIYQAKDALIYAQYIDSDGGLTEDAYDFWHQHPESAKLVEEWKTLATFAELPTLNSHYSLVAENSNTSLPSGPNYINAPGKKTISRVIGIHNIALKEGITSHRFEHFIRDNIHCLEDYPGWKFHLLKGQGGNRKDQYVVMLTIESLASLYEYHPDLDVSSEKALRFVAEHPVTEKMNDEWKKLASFPGAPQIYTDYLAIAGNGDCSR